LNPLPVATKPFQIINIDHKSLPRKTSQGHCALLCCIDAFSKFPIVSPVPDYSAETTAKVLMRDVISIFGIPSVIVSDRGSSFTGTLFKELTKILNCDHKISATHAARTNGQAESCVKRIVEGIRLYAKDDLSLESVIPVICMGLRASVHSKTCISPYEVLFGRPMPVANPPATLKLDDKLPASAKEYAKFVHDTLTDLHKGVETNIVLGKKDDKSHYDLRHKVVDPSWKVEDRVLVRNKRPDVRRNRILSHRPFDSAIWLITDLVKGPGIGVAYRLVNEATGKPHKGLVNHDRLKEFKADRSITPSTTTTAPTTTDHTDGHAKKRTELRIMKPAQRILRQSGPYRFLVLFEDNTQSWTDDVSPLLRKEWRIEQDRRRLLRRQNRVSK